MSVEQDPTTGEYILKQTHYDKQELLMHGEYEIISYKIGKQLTTNNQNEGNTGAPMQQAIPDDIMDMSARAAMEDDMSEEYHPISDDESLSSEQLMLPTTRVDRTSRTIPSIYTTWNSSVK